MHSSIVVDHISKRYRIGKGLTSLRDLLSFQNDSATAKFHWAAQDVCFELQPGQSLGVIGPNGAGKTTLLKILSRVTRPTSGKVLVNGRFSALIELGAGFHQDLTGRENIYLNGAILGMKRAEIKARFDRIVDFAGIGQYLDTPVKRYSSGMYARLGFAIAAHIDPDVLLVDEVLAVGDYAFQMKCYARMDELCRNGATLIFVSHNMEAVRRVCNQGLVMYRGKAIFQGGSSEAVAAYSNTIRQAARESQADVPTEGGLSGRVMTFDAEIERVSLLGADGQPASVFCSGDTARAVVDVQFHKDVSQPIFALTVRTPNGQLVYDTTTRWMNVPTPDFRAGDRCQVVFELKLPLLDGEYELGANIASQDLSHYYDHLERSNGFWVHNTDGAQGLADLGARISVEPGALVKLEK